MQVIYNPTKIQGVGNSTLLFLSGYDTNKRYFSVKLAPGLNNVSDRIGEHLRVSSDFAYLREGLLFESVVAEKVAVKEESLTTQEEPLSNRNVEELKQVISLSSLTVREAEPVIDKETNLDTLTAWRDSDSRRTIKEAIDQRMEKLTAPSTP